MKLRLRLVRLALRAPVPAAHGTVAVRELLLTAIDGGTAIGYGEAAPLPSYDGVTLADARDALQDCGDELAGAELPDVLDPVSRTELIARCAGRAVLPQALAGIDLAVWDLAGRATGQPVWRLLGAKDPGPVTVNATISAPDRAGAARAAAQARAAGFGTVKLKVGLGDDAGRVAAVRAAGGPALAIRLDANGAWSPDQATRWLEVLAPAGIELCEEPVAGAPEIEALAARAAVPLAIDESAIEPAALQRRCAQAICLKIARCGGISGTLAAAERARGLGYEAFLASSFDGPLGIAAALHAAALVRPDRASGLATLPMFADRSDPFPALGGEIAVPSAPGLGDALIGWYG